MENMSFEEAMARIEQIVKALEKGDVALEQSLTMFEEATGLIKNCGAILDEAEQKVVRLQKGADGQPQEFPFEDMPQP